MIQFDYSLEVDMGTEKRTYNPPKEIPKELKNIFRIQGPNSSGKSTLMNIIAIASHGLTKGKIPPSIRSRMEELVKPGYKDLEFEMTISDPVSKRALKSSKKKGETEVKVRESLDGGNSFSIIIADNFEKKYNLIYDIPENPVGRLNELTGEIKTVQNLFVGKTSEFQRYVEKTSNEIGNSMGPEEIKKLEDDLKFEEEALKKYNLEPEKAELASLKKLMVAYKLKEYNDKAEEAERIFNNAKKEIKNSDDSKAEKEYSKKTKELSKKVQSVSSSKFELVTEANKCNYPKFDELKNAMDGIGRDANAVIKRGGIPQSCVDAVSEVKNFADSISSSSKGESLRAMLEVIRVLDQYVDKNIELPEIGLLDEFLQNFKKKYKEMNSEYDIKSLKMISQKAKDIIGWVAEINQLVPTIIPPPEDKTESFEKEQHLDDLESQYKRANGNRSDYVSKVSFEMGISLVNLDDVINQCYSILGDEYKEKSFNEIKDAHDSKNNSIMRSESEKNNISSRTERLREKINKEKSKQASPYIEYKNEIKELQNQVSELMKSMNSANHKLEAVERKSYGSFQSDDPFFKSVWSYLGKRLKNIRHLDKEYDVSEVDLIDGIIITSDKTIIHLSDMGTGQSQLSYLKGLLSADDNRMVIALFDEVSTMTDSTLNVLFQEFEKLQKEGKLMVGMTVSPADEIEVNSYGV